MDRRHISTSPTELADETKEFDLSVVWRSADGLGVELPVGIVEHSIEFTKVRQCLQGPDRRTSRRAAENLWSE